MKSLSVYLKKKNTRQKTKQITCRKQIAMHKHTNQTSQENKQNYSNQKKARKNQSIKQNLK